MEQSYYYDISYTVVHGQVVEHRWGVRQSFVPPDQAHKHFLSRLNKHYARRVDSYQCSQVHPEDPRVKRAKWEAEDIGFSAMIARRDANRC